MDSRKAAGESEGVHKVICEALFWVVGEENKVDVLLFYKEVWVWNNKRG